MSGLVDPRAREASNLAFRADRLLSAGHVEAAREHFKLAAGLETEVLVTIPTTDPLFSTIAVSAVALYFKAHDAPGLLRVAALVLEVRTLTPGARAEIEEMQNEGHEWERTP